MRSTNILTAAGVAFAWIGVAIAADVPPGITKLARALDGRSAGNPVNCLTTRNIRSSRTIDGIAIIFEAGGTLYVNQPASGADILSDSKALVTKSSSFQLCQGEAVELFDMVSRIQGGSVILGQFIPYRKVQRNSLHQGSGMSANSGSGY